MLTKRTFVSSVLAFGMAGRVLTGRALAGPAPTGLTSLATNAQPIGADEYKARLARMQSLLKANNMAAFLVEAGTSLRYFTGIQWWTSERVTAAVIPADGQTLVFTPFFEEPSVRETLAIEADIRTWDEDQSPEALIVRSLADKKLSGAIAVEPETRFFIVDKLRQQGGVFPVVSGEALVNACRQIKSPAELALMQVANNITIAALRYVHANVEAGMSSRDISALMDSATVQLGGSPEFSMVLLNEASAYPHGSHQAETVRDGSVILMDCGCNVYGYQSDISRSWVFGAPTAKQRTVWETVRRGQEIALETARIGVPVGTIDDAVRAFYESQGWGPGYRLPGLSHRTGHGIGLDGPESAYLVHGDATPLAAGMCFSDEPGLYIPGEFGIRLEDCWHMTEDGPKLFTTLASSFDNPV